MYDAVTIQKELPILKDSLYENGNYIDAIPKSFICVNDLLHVTSNDGSTAIDYYGEFRGGYHYINPTLEQFAENMNMHWEWDDPESIVLVN